ncbi:MAG: right-handed parallel beta-helix repeat-containing protein [Blastocatellia bacterium]
MEKFNIRKVTFLRLVTFALIIAGLIFSTNFVKDDVSANHPVLVEGERDFDGDGRLGADEDGDNATDRVYGTITAGLLAANGAANANGQVIVVTSGRFPELIRIPNPDAGQMTVNGVTIVEAAPGVMADIDAVLAGNPNNGVRQAAVGVLINTDLTDRAIILRNLNIRNYLEGIQVLGASRVLIDNCRLDSNLNFGIRAMGTSRVNVTRTTVQASGMRFNPMMGTPGPGTGVRFEEQARGTIVDSTISGNTATGLSNGSTQSVVLSRTTVFDNGTNVSGTSASSFVKLSDEMTPEVENDSLR